MKTVALIFAIIFTVFGAGCGTSGGSSRPAPAKIDKSGDLQSGRKKLIDDLTSQGVFSEVVRNGSTMPRAWVTPRFDALNFKDKQNVISVIYAYYFEDQNEFNSVALINSRTGKEIGRFTSSGLSLD